MAAPQKFWVLTMANLVLGVCALRGGDRVGTVLGVLLLALAAFTALIAWRSAVRA